MISRFDEIAKFETLERCHIVEIHNHDMDPTCSEKSPIPALKIWYLSVFAHRASGRRAMFNWSKVSILTYGPVSVTRIDMDMHKGCSNKIIQAWTMILLLMFVAITGAAEQDQDVSLLVDADWLKKRLSDTDIVVLDVRGREDYLSGHISGAVNIPVDATFSPNPPKDRVANISYIQKLFGDAGIDTGTRVVIYDNGEYINAGRTFWVLEVYGHKKVMLLNGGYPAWLKKQYPVTEVEAKPVPKQFVAAIQPQRLATRLHTLLATEDDSKLILDARTSDEYNGKVSESARAGHIPSAINIPWDRNFQDVDGISTIKSFNELKQVYKEIDQSKKTITYCNKGRQSSFTYFILRQLGYDVSHYDGSWYEWGNDADLPIEK